MSAAVSILTAVPPEHPGGVETFVRQLQSGLQARGYQVNIVHRGNSLPGWMRHPSNGVSRSLHTTLSGYYVGRAARRQGGSQATISNGAIGWYLPLRRNGARHIHFYHGTYRGQAEALRPLLSPAGYVKMKWWDSMVLERASGRGKVCMANSDQTSDEVKRFFGLDAATVWLPLDTAAFRPLNRDECRARLGLPVAGAVALFVGSAHPQKGFPVIQSLMEQMDEVQWAVALRGPLPRGWEPAPSVRVLQDVAHDELPLFYSAADVLVCPSRYEPFGYVVAEALACGTPVVASPGGASRAFLDREPLSDLLVAHHGDTSGFAAAVRRVLSDPQRYRRAVLETARPRIEQWMAPPNWWRRFGEVSGL